MDRRRSRDGKAASAERDRFQRAAEAAPGSGDARPARILARDAGGRVGCVGGGPVARRLRGGRAGSGFGPGDGPRRSG
ncbi:hypothetical protein FVE89_23180 [Methylobacterium sp. 2A]|nr:hypothetical protein [Methylobacterium sp. 2A]